MCFGSTAENKVLPHNIYNTLGNMIEHFVDKRLRFANTLVKVATISSFVTSIAAQIKDAFIMITSVE